MAKSNKPTGHKDTCSCVVCVKTDKNYVPVFKPCSVDGCEKNIHARGFCKSHYETKRVTGKFLDIKNFRTCSINGCNTIHFTGGYCLKHRERYGNRHKDFTVEESEKRLKEQNNSCKGCKKIFTDDRWVIDHDHACCPPRHSCLKCRRGLLHDSCNKALGSVNDDYDTLINLANYLREHYKNNPQFNKQQ
jgi:hypothetical protein